MIRTAALVLCLFIPIAPVWANAIAQHYLGSNEQRTLSGVSHLHATPGARYDEAVITLTADARLLQLSASIGRQAHFILPASDYTYTFNTDTGRVDIHIPGITTPILSLPVDRQGLSTRITLANGNTARIQVDANHGFATRLEIEPSARELRFDVVGAVSVLVTDRIAAQANTAPSASARTKETDTPTAPVPVLIFQDDDTKQLQDSERNLRSRAGTSLFVIDARGQLRPGVHYQTDVHVLYTLMSHDSKMLYVALDPGYTANGELDSPGYRSTRALIAEQNCALYAVSLDDNSHTCVDAGYLPVPMTEAFRRAVSDGERKPLQLDREGNLYYLARPFQRIPNNSSGHDFDGATRTAQLRRYHVSSGQLRDLTPDIDTIGQFLVLNDGSLVYTATNTNSLNLVSFVGDRIVTNALTSLTDDNTTLSDVFFTVDESHTVLFGVSAGAEGQKGIQFGQRHPSIPDGRRLKQLNTSLFTSDPTQQPTPSRILMADDGYVYALFRQPNNTLELFRVLPYREDPLVTLPASLQNMDMQISKGYLYYVDVQKHPAGDYADRHIIQVRRLADGHTTALLADSNWQQRYRVFNWRISGDVLTFSAFDNNTTAVVMGEIDTLTVRRTGAPERALELRSLDSALEGVATIRDIEILRPRIPEADYGGNPRLVEVFTHPRNRYSVSLEFSKHMSISDLQSNLRIQAEETGQAVDALMVWQHRAVHLVLDKNPNVADTVALDEGKTYRIEIPQEGVFDRYGWDFNGHSESFTTASEQQLVVSIEAGPGGRVEPASRIVTANEAVSFTITPEPHYQAHVSGCNGQLDGTTYTTGIITESCTIQATFSATNHLVSVKEVTGGSVTPGSRYVNQGGTTSFTLIPYEGFSIAGAQGCGGTLSGTTYTTGPVTQACEISVSFQQESVPTHLVSARAGVGGFITPQTVVVSEGMSAEFTITPSAGFSIDFVNGCDGQRSGTTYTTGPVRGACTVVAGFKQDVPETYLISTQTGTGGTISPTRLSITPGRMASFTITPNTGYTIDLVTGCDGNLRDNLYTTGAITQNCTIVTSFARSTNLPPIPPTLGAVAGDGQVSLSWEAVDEATGYALYYGTNSHIHPSVNNSFIERVELGVMTTYTLSGLSNGVPYYFTLTAVRDGLESDPGPVAGATPLGASGQLGHTLLTDTGINWCANVNTNSLACPVASFPGQDGDFGRDAQARNNTLVKIGAGIAGFDYTKLGADGTPLSIQDQRWIATGSEAQGTHWSCVRDNHTGLTWAVKTTSGLHSTSHTYTWYSPDTGTQDGGTCTDSACDTHALVQAVNTQELCGLQGWRIPERQELRTLVNKGRAVAPRIDVEFFPNVHSGRYWTATPRGTSAWYIDFDNSVEGYSTTNIQQRAMLVHSASPPSSRTETICTFDMPASTPSQDFEVMENGLVYHKTTGLEWQRCAVGQQWDANQGGCVGTATTHTWQAALQLAAETDGWRVPSINELLSIVENCRNSPSINTLMFQGTGSTSRFWSSSPNVNDARFAWFVNFSTGSTAFSTSAGSTQGKGSTQFVRLVRDRQASH